MTYYKPFSFLMGISPMVAKGFQGPRGTLELCAPYTIWQAVLKGLVILRQKAYFGPDY